MLGQLKKFLIVSFISISFFHVTLQPVGDEGDIQTVYLIHNKTFHSIHLIANRNPKDYTAPPYENVIDSDKWAAFAMNRSVLEFSCRDSDKHGHLVDCRDPLELCQYKRPKFGTSTYGTYWIAQSTSLKAA